MSVYTERKYNEIWELYKFCRHSGIGCGIEPIHDGYKISFQNSGDFVQHEYSYGANEGCVEPAIGDEEFDYTAVGIELAKSLVLKHREKLERQRGDAEEHRKNTRQSELLKLFPNVIQSCGVLNICPKIVDTSQECRPVVCELCKRDFWLQEVE